MMKSLNVEQVGSISNLNNSLPHLSTNDKRLYSVLLTASLGYISVGYHLSSFHLICIFLWKKDPYDFQLSTFQDIWNGTFVLGTFLFALFLSFNRIKFTDSRKILILADSLMIFGTLCAFGVFLIDSFFIFFGRLVCAASAAINVTCILTFVREAQFYLSQSRSKAETRCLFGEGLFAVGVLLGFLLSGWMPFQKVIDREAGFTSYFLTFILISAVPLGVSIARIVYLRRLGDLRSSGYAQPFTDEGLLGDAEENQDDRDTLYMLKFREVKSLVKLFKKPYRRRLLICILLYILQAAVGYFLLVFEPYNFSMLLYGGYKNAQKNLIKFAAIFFSVLVLLSLNFLRKKVSRKCFMYLGALGGVAGAALCLNDISTDFDMSTVLFGYYVAICFGFGFAVELYIEEILPAKGIQFLQTIKWLLIAIMNILVSLTRFLGRVYTLDIPIYVFFVANIIALIVICKFVPETANLSEAQINTLFGGPEHGINKDLDRTEDSIATEST